MSMLCALLIGLTVFVVSPQPWQADLRWGLPACGVFMVLALASRLGAWERLPQTAGLIFPVTTFVTIALLDRASAQAGPAYLGLFTLWFMVVGVGQRPAVGWALTPVAGAAWWQVNGALDAQHVVRLSLAVVVWGTLSTALALRAGSSSRRELALSEQAETDALTGLPNRRALDVWLGRLTPGDVVVLIDLDHFKVVNDTGGHAFGDQVLVDFAATLASVVRGGDVVARFGGEEFVLVLPGNDRLGLGSASVLARLKGVWSTLHPTITWSAGATCHEAGADPQQTLREADRALYEAKRAGRDRVVVSSDRPELAGVGVAVAALRAGS
jgi:diguanylate cyclase (GGDEF)-like protein